MFTNFISYFTSKGKTAFLIWSIFAVAIGLRLILYAANPPQNAYDNHFEPTFLIIQNGNLPFKNECHECFQPPLFYVTSAATAWVLFKFGASYYQTLKFLQFLSCLYGILTVFFVYLILKRLPLDIRGRLSALAIISILPRHVYTSAMYSNDTMASLAIAICIYFAFITIEKNFSFFPTFVLSLFTCVALITKQTALVLFPVILSIYIYAFYLNAGTRKKLAKSLFLVMSLPLLTIVGQALIDFHHYGIPFPLNYDFLAKKITHLPGSEYISFYSFKLWLFLIMPIIGPDSINSFWSVTFASLWHDVEPKFLPLIIANKNMWSDYYHYLMGKIYLWPGVTLPISTILIGRGLIFLGMVLFIPKIIGLISSVLHIKENRYTRAESIKMSIFPILLLSNVAGALILTSKIPSFSCMKSTYFLNSLTAFAVFFGMGTMAIKKYNFLYLTIIITLILLFGLVTMHIIQISLTSPQV